MSGLAVLLARAPASEIRRLIEEILARPEFGSRQPLPPLERLREWAGQWLSRLLISFIGSAAMSPLWIGLLIGALLALVVAVVAIARLRPWREARASAAVRVIAAGQDPSAVRAQAAEAARAGRFREAVRLLYLALLLALSRREVLRYDGTRTNWEYLAAVHDRAFYHPMRDLTGLFDRVWYGGEPAGAEEYARATVLAESVERDAARG